MKHLLVQYATYNHWANKRMADLISNLSDDQLHREINSSFHSIFKTFAHMWDVEHIWFKRIRLEENIEWPSHSFNGSVMELSTHLLQQSKQWKDWIELATENALEHEFIYRNSKKQQFKQPVYEALMQVFNHQTFHRGQLITMLRQVGVTKLPVTDLIAFLRKK